MSEIQNFILAHKPFNVPKEFLNSKIISLRSFGTAKNFHLDTYYDNQGINIANKNPLYAELTGFYWLYKNSSYNNIVISFSHYRRYFNFHKLNKRTIDLVKDKRIHFIVPVKEYQFIRLFKFLPVPITKEIAYKLHHQKEDWTILIETLVELYPQDDDFIKKFSNSYGIHPYNIFCCHIEEFYSYCEWLFPICEMIESKVKRSGYSYQHRTIGFLAERLFNFYLVYFKKVTKTCPIILSDE